MKTYELNNKNVTFSHPEFKVSGILKNGQYGEYVMFKEDDKVIFCNPNARTAKGLKGLIINVVSDCEPDEIVLDKFAWMGNVDWGKEAERQAEVAIEIETFVIEKEYQEYLQLEKNKAKYEEKKQYHISNSKNCTCTRCCGSGRVRYNYANGICFKCFGTGKI